MPTLFLIRYHFDKLDYARCSFCANQCRVFRVGVDKISDLFLKIRSENLSKRIAEVQNPSQRQLFQNPVRKNPSQRQLCLGFCDRKIPLEKNPSQRQLCLGFCDGKIPLEKNPSQRQLYLGFPTAKPLVKDNYFRKKPQSKTTMVGFLKRKKQFRMHCIRILVCILSFT